MNLYSQTDPLYDRESNYESRLKMTQVQIYWRDMVVHLLEIGGGLFVLFAAWGLSNNSKFDFFGNRDRRLAAYGLLLVTAIYSFIFPVGIDYIYRKFLNQHLDGTVLPYTFAILSATFLSLGTLTIAILLSKITLPFRPYQQDHDKK